MSCWSTFTGAAALLEKAVNVLQEMLQLQQQTAREMLETQRETALTLQSIATATVNLERRAMLENLTGPEAARVLVIHLAEYQPWGRKRPGAPSRPAGM